MDLDKVEAGSWGGRCAECIIRTTRLAHYTHRHAGHRLRPSPPGRWWFRVTRSVEREAWDYRKAQRKQLESQINEGPPP